MTLTQKILSVASLGLAFATVSFAQTDSASLLGVRYVEAGFGYYDINNSNIDAFSVGANVNVPVTANLDLSASYSYDWVEDNHSVYQNSALVRATGYITEGAFRPFVTGGIGYVWESENLGDDDYGFWTAGLGVEYSFTSQTALTLSGHYSDTFRSGAEDSFSGSARLSHWFTSAIAGTVGVTWIEEGDLAYSVTAIFKF